jgi:selenocysteine-specific elongation factor
VSREGVVRVLPAGGTARVRGVETHGQAAERALPGSRAALALAGVAVDDVRRGTVLVSDGAWEPSHVLLAEVALLASAAVPLGPRSRVRFHLGTVDVGARIVTPGGALPPGGRKQARVVLDAPVIARAGDRFVIRGGSPVVTLGGGIVNDPTPPHRRPRPWSASAPSPQDRLARVLASAGNSGVARTALPVRIGASPTTVHALLASAHGAIVAGDRLFAERVVHDAAARLVALVDAHHAHAPLEQGASLQAVRARLAVPDEVAARLVADAVARGELELDGGAVRRAGWVPALDDAQRRRRDELLATLQQAGREPPSVPELAARHGGDTQALLRLLERDGHVVQVEAERYYARPVLDDMIAQLRAQLAPGREYSPGDFRDLLGFSRKYLIPFLEYCDRVGITERRPGGRVPLTPADRAHPSVEGGAGP